MFSCLILDLFHHLGLTPTKLHGWQPCPSSRTFRWIFQLKILFCHTWGVNVWFFSQVSKAVWFGLVSFIFFFFSFIFFWGEGGVSAFLDDCGLQFLWSPHLALIEGPSLFIFAKFCFGFSEIFGWLVKEIPKLFWLGYLFLRSCRVF